MIAQDFVSQGVKIIGKGISTLPDNFCSGIPWVSCSATF